LREENGWAQERETAGHWWLMPVILATEDTKIRRIVV
jgi:hypothetical protein